jgi:hypothetical protein
LAPYNEDDKCLPDKTLSFKKEKCHGNKLSKERVTCLLCVNMSGTEKLRVLLIGKSAKPRCFKGIKWFPVDYRSNKKAWMTSDIFENWLLSLDKYFSKQGRKVLFLIDNCTAHPQIQHKLKAIKLCFFPPNATSKLQPLDQGIINSFKCHYKRRILTKVVESYELSNTIPKMNLFDCVKTVSAVWNNDVSQKTIQNCFKKAGFGKHSCYDEEDEIPLSELKERLMETDEEHLNNVTDIFGKFVEIHGLEDVSLDVFLTMDNDLATRESPTDQEIIESINTPSTSQENTLNDSDEESLLAKPSHSEVRNAFDTLTRLFTMEENTTDTIYNSLNNIERFYDTNCIKKTVRQNLITNYMH